MRQEDYAAAARLKAALSGVQAQDTVAAVQAKLSAALQEERYGDAVVIRDEGMAWMQVCDMRHGVKAHHLSRFGLRGAICLGARGAILFSTLSQEKQKAV